MKRGRWSLQTWVPRIGAWLLCDDANEYGRNRIVSEADLEDLRALLAVFPADRTRTTPGGTGEKAQPKDTRGGG